MDDDLHVAALGDKLDIARIQARRACAMRTPFSPLVWWRRSLKRLPIVCV